VEFIHKIRTSNTSPSSRNVYTHAFALILVPALLILVTLYVFLY